MYFKQWDIPCTSADGTIPFTLTFVLPVLTEAEATQFLNDTANWTNSTVVYDPRNNSLTSEGELLFNTYGLGSTTIPYLTPYVDYPTSYRDAVKTVIPGLTNITDTLQTLPISSSTSTFNRREFTSNINGVTYTNNTYNTPLTASVKDIGDMYLALSTTSRDSVFTSRYKYGGASTLENGMDFTIQMVWLVDGVSDYVLATIGSGVGGYYNYSPRGLFCAGVAKRSTGTAYSEIYKIAKLWFLDNSTGKKVDPLINNDPYANGGSTDSGGGTGDFDGSSDAIGIPDLPSASATDAGFITLFNPTLSQMQSLASYMWSDLFDLDAWRKIFADPMDAILGLSIVPVKVGSSGTREVKVGNISTGVTMDVASSQYVKVDCGTLNVKEYWGAYLDYEPFTKAEIYLPYIGTHPIAVDDIMGKAVHVEYHVDILSGACVAYVQCTGGKLDSVLYNFVGQCSSSIPITGNDWTNVVNGVLSIAGSIGTMVATGGAAAPFAVGEIASSAVNSMKPTVEKSGSVSGTGGLMGIQKPYLILTRPRQAVPKNQYKYTGYPAYINRKLSDLKGYTEVDQIHIEGVYATEQEYSELDSLIRSGVIF